MTTKTTSPQQTEPGGGAGNGRLDRKLAVLGMVIALGILPSILDATIVNVAVRTLGQEFHASIATVQWVLTAYLLGFASVIPVTGWASERFGAKRVWLASVGLFLAGSVLCGIATSVPELIVFRVLQGIGGGMILPVGQTILAQVAGPQRMARVMSFIGVPLLMGSVAGPVLGGVLISAADWRWIFFINLPVGLAAMALAHRVLPTSAPSRDAQLDVRGLGLLSAGVALFVYGMSEAGNRGFDAGRTWLFLGAGAALLALYCAHARRRGGRALIDISLFGDRGFAASAATNLAVAIALFGVLVLLPLYWQVVRGHDVLVTGLLLAPQALGAAVAMPLAGRLTDRLGGGVVVPVGIGLALLGTGVYTQVDAYSTASAYVILSVALFVIGLGLGATIMPSIAAAYRSLPRQSIAKATSALNTIQRLGASIGTTVLAVLLQHGIDSGAPMTRAFSSAYWLAFGLTAVALVPALLLPRNGKRAAARKG